MRRFDEDAKLCNPTLMNDVHMPMVNYAGIDEAFWLSDTGKQ